MNNLAKVPKIRFKEFSDAWEQCKFKNLALIERGGSPRPIEDFITTDSNGLNWVKIGDAPELGRYITSTEEKIRPEGLSKTREVHPGDLVLSNSMSFGKPYIMGIDGCIHDGWLLIRLNKNCDLKYFCHLLGSEEMLKQYRAFAAGSTVNNLNKQLVSETVISFPKKQEQGDIGEFFEQFDNLITLHQRKLEKLQNLKKALLEKMFPRNGSKYPEIRFKGFSDEWSICKLSEIADFYRGNGLSWADVTQNGKYECILYGNLYTDYGMIIDKVLYRTNVLVKNPTYSCFGDVLIPGSDTTPTGLARATCIEREGVLLGGDINVIRPKQSFYGSCLSLSINANKEKLLKIIKGSTVRHIQNSDIKNIILIMPTSLAEQKLLSKFFKGIDRFIYLNQRKLEKLQNLKKALLEKMFV